MSLSTIPTDSTTSKKHPESAAVGGVPCWASGGQKFGNSQNSVWGYSNPLKFHKTAKGIFGNPWRKQAWIWKSLAKKAWSEPEASERRREVASRNPGPNRVRLRPVIVIALSVSLD